jgi:hypothetical protein
MGCNAIRCAHNPPTPELLDACDELGMLVIDENRLFGSSVEHLHQLDAMVRRDRNHPSVILWSICNEEAIQGTAISGQIARTMIARVQQLDPTRPVTAAVSGGLLNDGAIGSVVPVMSINYQLAKHDEYHAKYPNIPLIAGETGCVYATRGETSTDIEKHRHADDDTGTAPWGTKARETFDFVMARPFIAGYFVWTGFDYRGEPPPHAWPSVQTHWGLLDLCGFPKETAFRHSEWWGGSLHGGQNLMGSYERMRVQETSAVAWGAEVDPTSALDPIVSDGEHAFCVTVFAVDASGARVAHGRRGLGPLRGRRPGPDFGKRERRSDLSRAQSRIEPVAVQRAGAAHRPDALRARHDPPSFHRRRIAGLHAGRASRIVAAPAAPAADASPLADRRVASESGLRQ